MKIVRANREQTNRIIARCNVDPLYRHDELSVLAVHGCGLLIVKEHKERSTLSIRFAIGKNLIEKMDWLVEWCKENGFNWIDCYYESESRRRLFMRYGFMQWDNNSLVYPL